MRSRYSAYVYKQINYIIETTHPKKRSKNIQCEIEKWIHLPKWEKLEIKKTFLGKQSDVTGKVEFFAHYKLNEKMHTMKEYSRFKKYKGKWYYFDDKG